jgi:hypothetical protein
MKKFLLTLLVIIIACAIPLIGFSQDKPENMRPRKQMMMKQDCGEKNFYDKYSKDYLNRRDCQEEMRTQNRVFIQDYTYQPFFYGGSIIINRNHGWLR